MIIKLSRVFIEGMKLVERSISFNDAKPSLKTLIIK